jgi:hypothetical protein
MKWVNYPDPNHLQLLSEGAAQTADEAIMAKIMKLLALAGSPNPHEAELAMQRAHELMAKYDIDMGDVKKDEKKYVDDICPTGKTLFDEHLLVARICRDYFKIQYFIDGIADERGYRTGKGIRFVGKKHHVEISLYVFSFLVYNFRKIYKRTKREIEVRDKRSFMHGLYDGLNQKLKQSNEKIKQEYGIVPIEDAELKSFVKENWKLGNLKRSNHGVNSDSYGKGVEKGKEIDIHGGIQAGKTAAGPKALPGA